MIIQRWRGGNSLAGLGVAIIADVILFANMANMTQVFLTTENTESTEISYVLGGDFKSSELATPAGRDGIRWQAERKLCPVLGGERFKACPDLGIKRIWRALTVYHHSGCRGDIPYRPLASAFYESSGGRLDKSPLHRSFRRKDLSRLAPFSVEIWSAADERFRASPDAVECCADKRGVGSSNRAVPAS